MWSFHHGDNDYYRGGPHVFWELMNQENYYGVILQKLNEDLDNGLIIDKTNISSSSLSLKEIKNNLYWESVGMFMRSLKRLYYFGPDSCFQMNTKNFKFYSNRIYKKPTNSEFALPLFFYLQRILKRKLKNLFSIPNGIFLFVNQINLKHL